MAQAAMVCGDKVCSTQESGNPEDADYCAVDCGPYGDGVCGHHEMCQNGGLCPKDSASACGNGKCEGGESTQSCITDCSGCGDGMCGLNESPQLCAADCPPPCGNHECEVLENPENCPVDCMPPCGDGICDNGENPQFCPVDCTICGDDICGAGETIANCPKDCATACGNMECEGGESPQVCPVDCGPCGDGVCSFQESPNTCPTDCPMGCGDGQCSATETCTTCATDCGTCPCLPDCQEKQCGNDGCGGSCGECMGGETCQAGQCTFGNCWPNCGDEVLVPAGKFWMGCNAAVDTACDSGEMPYHEVYLDGYYMDRTEVTVDAYGSCVTAGSCTPPSTYSSYCNWNKPGKGDHPVNCIEWFQAKAYCEWAGKRLPNEAEWEKGARGTDGRKYPWGNAPATCDYTVINGNGALGCGTDSTMSVCSKSPAGDSPYGLCDMAGNVWEWTADWHSSSYYSSSPTNNPAGPTSGSDRVKRGGSFGSSFGYGLRVSFRGYASPSDVECYLGFRCARSE